MTLPARLRRFVQARRRTGCDDLLSIEHEDLGLGPKTA
jgi:hypothetical protein